MRIGLAGLGRIGAFHASTLSQLDAVDELVLVDAHAGCRRRSPGSLGAGWSPPTSDPAGRRHRRAGHRRGHRRIPPCSPRPPPGGLSTFCEKPLADSPRRRSRLARRRGVRRAGPGRLPAPLRRRLRRRARRGRCRRARLGCTPSVSTTLDPAPPHAAATSRPPAASSATAACTTSTRSAGSSAARSVAVYATGWQPGRADSSREPATSTRRGRRADPRRRLASPSSPPAATTPRGYDVRMEVHGTRRLHLRRARTARCRCARSKPGADLPGRRRDPVFMDRFRAAYAPSWPRSSTWSRGAARARAPSRTRWRPSRSPRPATVAAPSTGR